MALLSILVLALFGFASYFPFVGFFAMSELLASRPGLQSLVPALVCFASVAYLAKLSDSFLESLALGFRLLGASFVVMSLGSLVGALRGVSFFEKSLSAGLFTAVALPLLAFAVLEALARFFKARV